MLKPAAAVMMLGWVVSLPVAAEVFKCQQGDGKVLYQDYSCKGIPKAAPMDLPPDQPTYRDQMVARQRAAAERRFVQQAEAERETNKALARQEESTKARVVARNDEQCDSYTSRAD